jgi:hypothetical protein
MSKQYRINQVVEVEEIKFYGVKPPYKHYMIKTPDGETSGIPADLFEALFTEVTEND